MLPPVVPQQYYTQIFNNLLLSNHLVHMIYSTKKWMLKQKCCYHSSSFIKLWMIIPRCRLNWENTLLFHHGIVAFSRTPVHCNQLWRKLAQFFFFLILFVILLVHLSFFPQQHRGHISSLLMFVFHLMSLLLKVFSMSCF